MRLVLVNNRLNKIGVINRAVFGISLFLLLFHAIGIIDIKGIMIIAATSLLLISTMALSIFKGHSIKGYIQLSQNCIEIVEGGSTKKYFIDELNYLKIKIFSYKGQRGITSLTDFVGANGLGNYISIGKDDEKYHLYLKDKIERDKLIDYVEYLQSECNSKVDFEMAGIW